MNGTYDQVGFYSCNVANLISKTCSKMTLNVEYRLLNMCEYMCIYRVSESDDESPNSSGT